MSEISNIKNMDTHVETICYKSETIEKILNIINTLPVSGINTVTGLAAIINLLNMPDGQNKQ